MDKSQFKRWGFTASCLCTLFLGLPAPGQEGYVFSSFTGNGEDGLHLLMSMDGVTWQNVANYASVYQQSEGLMRDPSICLGGDNKYHMVWTAEWWDHRIGISHSTNLLNWETNRFLYVWADYNGPGDEQSDGSGWPGNLYAPVPRNSLVKNCWAPEIFYDDQTGEYVIFWATTIDNASVFPQTWDPNRWEHTNHRIYYITTTDFVTFTPRRFFYAPADRVVIDAMIRKTGPGDYRMVIKDELAQTLHICSPKTNLTSWATMPTNFWSTMSSPAFTGAGIQPDNTAAEGPSTVQTGNEWLVYCDYWQANRNGLFSTTDFKTLTRINDEFSAPEWIRHGTVFKAPLAVVEALNPAHPAAYARALEADTVTTTSARLPGRLTYSSTGSSASAFVFWGPTSGGTVKNNWQNRIPLGTQPVGTTFYTNLTGLSHKTVYYYSVYGSNSAGSGWSRVASFQTPSAIDVVTSSANQVGLFDATLNGTVNPRGTAAYTWFEYGPTTSYGTRTALGSAGIGSSAVSFSKAISGLTLNTQYHFRACGSNSLGMLDFGSDQTFQTRAPIETTAATAVTTAAAQLNGNVCPNGVSTYTWFEYGTTTGYGSRTTPVAAGSGTAFTACSSAINALAPNTLYHFRAACSNLLGTVYTGADMTFQTLTSASMLSYNFDDGTLQGWSVVASDPGNSPDPTNYASVTANNGVTAQSGTRFVMCSPGGSRDNPHKTLWIRSPQFVINQAGNLTLWLAGGTGLGGYPGGLATLPTKASQIPLNVDSTANGIMGVALRDTATGDFVLTAQRPAPSDASWVQISWDVSEYRNNGKTYTVELFDYHSDTGWAFLCLDSVTIPGTTNGILSGAAVTAPFTTTFGKASAVQSFPVSGANLTANLVATGPTGLELSSDGVIFGSSAVFAQTGGIASGNLRVRLAATAAVGTYNNLNIVLSSTGAANVNITTPPSGNVVQAITPPLFSGSSLRLSGRTAVFVVSNTLTGYQYTLLFKSNLADPSWSSLSGPATAPGNDGSLTLTDTNRPQALGFYRLLMQ